MKQKYNYKLIIENARPLDAIKNGDKWWHYGF
jgi:hypothetical protein